MTSTLIKWALVIVAAGRFQNGELVGFNGVLVGTDGLDVTYDGKADFESSKGFAGFTVHISGKVNAACNIFNGDTTEVDWQPDMSKSIGTCPLTIGQTNDLDAQLVDDGVLFYQRDLNMFYWTLKADSTFLTRGVVTASIHGYFRPATRSIEPLVGSNGVVTIAGGGANLEERQCRVLRDTDGALDCSQNSAFDGVADYVGLTGVYFFLSHPMEDGCNVYYPFTYKRIAWALDTGPCPGTNRWASIMMDGRMRIGYSVFAGSAVDFLGGGIVNFLGVPLLNGDIDTDHDGKADILTTNPMTTTSTTLEPSTTTPQATTRSSSVTMPIPVGEQTGPIVHKAGDTISMTGFLVPGLGVDISERGRDCGLHRWYQYAGCKY